ncbi:SMP-30/gluconolactonase/LRE family protein [Shinella sp. CPCC 101442]|uniref:SMP-30/gluconolactonase/LRE family protein n=1 Tax=Shinella sp. CPCC 101442 TaxID=2932265 RepID=UPI00215359DA|nr:SMP-30/gluconolactonase/LRE family protein [Shinella sp. CPCC 101442]MCR6499245.1 SMP-30/gluconolactonase/LRE family protein [Shinella sp. CPCC 101442]
MTETHSFTGRILDEVDCQLGEGPTYDPATDKAFWFDIKGRKLHELHLPTMSKAVHDLPFLGSVLAVVDAERQLIVSDQGLFIHSVADGTLAPFARLEDNPVNRSNDGRVHPSGALWASTMGRRAEKHSGAIYHVAGTTVTKLFSNITIPNSICFSPDGGTGYFTDTDINHLMRVALDPKTGLPVGEPELLSDESGTSGGVDGSVCDADGLIWNARWGSNAVDVYKPDGTKVARYLVPASQSSCPAFIGKNADRLLVTSAWQDMDDAARLADPHAGRTFELGIAVKGRFEPKFSI